MTNPIEAAKAWLALQPSEDGRTFYDMHPEVIVRGLLAERETADDQATLIRNLVDRTNEQAAEIDRLLGALNGLVGKLDAVHADARYETVWAVSQIHIGPYSGPTYTDELTAARAALYPEAGEK